jgi:hypothetical protein
LVLFHGALLSNGTVSVANSKEARCTVSIAARSASLHDQHRCTISIAARSASLHDQHRCTISIAA